MSGYQRMIMGILAVAGIQGNPRWIEAWMRVDNPTLDGLSPREFEAELWAAVSVIPDTTEAECEQLARSMGL